VGRYLEDWLAGKRKLRPSTRRSYESHIRVHLAPRIGQLRLSDLRADHLDAAYDSIRQGMDGQRPPSPATVRRIHATLHSALASAYKRRLIPMNVAGQVELESVKRPVRGIWTPAELGRFLDHAQHDRLGAAYYLLAFTGMRRGEMCGLRWNNVDLDAGIAHINQQHVEIGRQIVVGEPKTKRGVRTIGLDADLIVVLRRHKAAQAAERLALGTLYQDHDLLFAKEDGTPLRPEYVTRHFLTLSQEIGLPRIVLHGLRHMRASHALAAGIDLVIVSRDLGHSSSYFTADNYTQVPQEQSRLAAEQVAEMYRVMRAHDTLRGGAKGTP
jgi:integrase